MEDILHSGASYLALILEALALLAIAIGTVEAVVDVVRLQFRSIVGEAQRSRVWLRFARWLVAGLTFQLGADIVHTTIAPAWDEIGRVAAIAAIRTFLTFFLDRDIAAEYERTDAEKESGKR